MCIYSKLIDNPKFRANKKNGGVIPPLPIRIVNGRKIEDKRVKLVPIGCGKCIECRKKEANKWRIRLQEEIKNNERGVFVTLTMSNEEYKRIGAKVRTEGYERDNDIMTKEVRYFLERVRKKTGKSLRHWLITELGHEGTENIHAHGIIWTDNPELIKEKWNSFAWLSTDNNGWVNGQTVNYIIKYVTKIDDKHKGFKGKVLTSAGIGKGYINKRDAKHNKYKEGKTNEQYKTQQGYKIGLPIYYRNKIYNEEEREKLWQEKLDKQVMYVLGNEIDVSKGYEGYNRAIGFAREHNKKMGYGGEQMSYEERWAELQRRRME